MLFGPVMRHASEDDDAPLDYSFVSSVSEGRRILREAGMNSDKPALSDHSDRFRHAPAPIHGMRARREAAEYMPKNEGLIRKLDEINAKEVPASEPVREGTWAASIPENPFLPQESPASDTLKSTAGTGTRIAVPDAPGETEELPEWLRVARQNNYPSARSQEHSRSERIRRSASSDELPTDVLGRPMVSRARSSAFSADGERSAREYAEAGYPRELVETRLRQENDLKVQPVRRRHGAQYAYPLREGEKNLSGSHPARSAFFDRIPEQDDAAVPETVREERISPASVSDPSAESDENPQNAAPFSSAGKSARRSRAYALAEEPASDRHVHQPLSGNFFRPNQSAAFERDGSTASRVLRPSLPGGGFSDEASEEQPDPAPSDRSPYARPQSAPSGRSQAAAAASARGSEGPLFAAPAAGEQLTRYAHVLPADTDDENFVHRTYPDRETPAQETYSVREEEDTESEDRTVAAFPKGLAIAAGLVLLAAVLLFAGIKIYEAKTQSVYRQREAAQARLLSAHPYNYRDFIDLTAKRYNLSPAFVASIVLNESSFNPKAESRVGARGLMQMMNDTAEWIHGKLNDGTVYSFDAMYDPETNIEYGCWYLRYLSDSFYGDPILVSAAYHAGQGEIKNWLNNSLYSLDHRTIPLKNMPEGPTRNYATKVVTDYAVYQRLYYESPEEGSL